MPDTLRVLMVEDDPDDAALIERELRRSGLSLEAERVDTARATRAALLGGSWDLVLADFALPGFRGIEAMAMLREVDADAPFIIVSGAIDANTAVEAMKAGAADYVLKDELVRLPIVIKRELEAAEVRRERREAARERDRALVELNTVLVDLQTANDQLRSLAAENARLYEAEHRISETFQEALFAMPYEIPTVDYFVKYVSAAEHARVGGDFYDLFEIEAGEVGIVIGDVSGKGLGAAAVASMVRNVIRASAVDCASPASVMAKTSDVVFRFTGSETFVTVFFAILDTRSGDLTWVSAGHPPALIKRVGGPVDVLGLTSPLAGAFLHAEYEEHSTTLEDGEVLFLHTDGLNEARVNGELYGESRAMLALSTLPSGGSPESVVNAVFADVQAFAGVRHQDDMALMAVRLAR